MNPHRTSPEDFFIARQFIPRLLGEYLLNEIQFKTIKKSGEIYHYEEGIYKENGRERIKNLCAEILRNKFTRHRAAETINYIQAMTYIDAQDLSCHNWVNLNNGLLNPLTREFINHTPDIFTIKRIPINYNPDAECPIWKKELQKKIDATTYKVLQEFFGYLFLRGQKYERALLLYGPKRTMKSTTLKIMGKIIGQENTTAISLQQLSADRFALGYLYGIPLNVCADIDARGIKFSDVFKQVTGGDKITAGKKGQHLITFNPDTKLVFSANVIPSAPGHDLAYYRRWLLLAFEKETPPAEINPNMDKILTNELAGILNWCLEGLERLEIQEKFSYWLSDEDNRDLYERHSNSIQSFIHYTIDMENDEGKITKREIYKRYKNYCKKEGLNLENQIKFGRVFRELTGCGTGRKGDIPAYTGITIKAKSTETSLNNYV